MKIHDKNDGTIFRFPIRNDESYLANGQPFKLLGITYLIGKIKFKLFFQGPLAM